MKRIHGLLYAVALLGLIAGTLTSWAQSDQPSLADVARQKSAAKARKVVTNDEIPPSPEANNPPSSSSAASAAPGSSAPAAPQPDANSAAKDSDKNAKPAEKPTRWQQLMLEHDNLVNIIKHTQAKIDASTDQARIDSLTDVLQRAKDSLVENEQEIDKLKASSAATGQGDTEPAANQPPAAGQPPVAEQPPAAGEQPPPK